MPPDETPRATTTAPALAHSIVPTLAPTTSPALTPDPLEPAPDLDFHGARTAYATHGVHSFAAKFPPQLAAWGIETFSAPDETVLDPMVGSGTTLVEARLRGRHALGVDIDPLARLIARVKSAEYDSDELRIAAAAVADRARRAILELRDARARGATLADTFPHVRVPDFPNRDYWFLPTVVDELATLRWCLDRVEPLPIREFFYLVFSAMIITKSSTSVANVRDLAHSRPHFALAARAPDVLATFERRLARLVAATTDFARRADPATIARVVGDDARRLPLPDASVDLVFTSPPYVNAIDYPRAHKFSLHWLADALGTSPDAYRDLGRRYVGTDRVAAAERAALLDSPLGVPLADDLISRLSSIDPRRAAVTRRYVADMSLVLGEIARVLRPGRHAVVVVCPSSIGRLHIPTEQIFADLAAPFGLSNLRTLERRLDDAKRQLPLHRGPHGPGMRLEYVVILRKE